MAVFTILIGLTNTLMGQYTIIQKPEIRIVGIDCRAANFTPEGPQEIGKLWNRFYNEDILNRIPNRISDDVVGLYCDYDGDYTQPYTLVIGCIVTSDEEIPEGMVSKKISAGTYAVFDAVGEHPASLIETWGAIWQTDLTRTYLGDFEYYGDDFFKKSPQEVKVYIHIKED